MKIKKKPRTASLNVRIDEDVMKRLKSLAKEHKSNLTQVVKTAIQNLIGD